MHLNINFFVLIVFLISGFVNCSDENNGGKIKRNSDHNPNFNPAHNLQPLQPQQNYINPPKSPELINNLVPNINGYPNLQNNNPNNSLHLPTGNQHASNFLGNSNNDPNNIGDILINNPSLNRNPNQHHAIPNQNANQQHSQQNQQQIPNQHSAQQETQFAAPKGRTMGMISNKLTGEINFKRSQFENLIEDDAKQKFAGNNQQMNQQISENLKTSLFDLSSDKKCLTKDCADPNSSSNQLDVRSNLKNLLSGVSNSNKNLYNVFSSNQQTESNKQTNSLNFMSAVNLDAKLNTELNTKLNTKLDAKLDTQSDTKLVTKLDAQLDTKLVTKLDTKLNTKLDTKSNTLLDTKSNTLLDTKSNTLLDTKLDITNRSTNLNLISDLPVVFNKDYSLTNYNNSVYMNQKLLDTQNSQNLKISNKKFTNLSSHSIAVASSVVGFIGQIKSSKLGLINSIIGLNTFGVKDEQTNSVCSIANQELFVSSSSHSTSMLCMSTVCVPSSAVDIVNNYEFTQCALSCLTNAKSTLALYVYKNFDNLSENLKIKSVYSSKLQSTLTTSLVTEGIDYLVKPNSGLNVEQVTELQTFRKTLLTQSMP